VASCWRWKLTARKANAKRIKSFVSWASGLFIRPLQDDSAFTSPPRCTRLDRQRSASAIRQVRQFCTSFSRTWPFWLFACNLELPSLQTLTFSCLYSLRLIRRDGGSLMRVQYAQQELGEFLERQFPGMNLLFERAGMPEAENRQRTQQILDFYRRDWSSFALMASA
jgi:hypothetical protein